MKRMSRILMMAVLTISACLMSCGETIVIGNTDKPTPKPEPTPTPTPTPTPETVIKATDLLADALKEGSIVVFWFTYANEEYSAVFKKVGDDYVLQNGAANTRGDDTQSNGYLHKKLNVINGSSEKLLFTVMAQQIILQQLVVNVGNAGARQLTIDPKTLVNAAAVMPSESAAKKSPDELDEAFCKLMMGDITEELTDNIMLPKASLDGSSVTMTSVGELKAEAAAKGQTVEETIKETVDDYTDKVKNDVSAGGGIFVPISITLEPESLEMTVGESKQLKAIVAPSNASQDVTWTSDDERVATVDAEGNVTAVAAGEAIIIVTSKDGGFSAECKVTVNKKAEGSISFATTTVEKLTTDAAFTNTLTNTGDGQVTYSSNKETVAKVNETTGQVTITGVGEATITATVKDSETYAYATNTATYQITVTEAIIAVTGVSLNKTELGLTIDNTETLTATVAPTDASNKAVTWKSSKESVAKVDANGKVTAVGAGEAIITVTTTDGEKSAECKVTVSKKAGSISYATTTVEKLTTDAAFTNTLTKTGDGSVTYSSDKETVATVNSSTGEVTIKGVGEATITATVADSDTYTYSTKTATYKVKVVASSGLKDYNRNDPDTW